MCNVHTVIRLISQALEQQANGMAEERAIQAQKTADKLNAILALL